jgi:sporulation protein YlmC with PRC-barrel domain
LVKKQAVSKNPELDNSMLDIFYGNYQIVQGLNIPFKSVSKVGDQTILTTTVEKVEINTPISNEDFKP